MWDLYFFETIDFVKMIIILALIFLTIQLYWKEVNRLPPGPSGWPWLGYTSCLGDNAFHEIQKLESKYGDIVSFKLFGHLVVVLNSYDAIREVALGNMAKVGRFTMSVNNQMAKKFGISNYDTPRAMTLRKALVRHMYELSTDAESKRKINKVLSQIASEEAQILVNNLKMLQEKPVNVVKLMRLTVWRIMWRFVFAQECPMKVEEIEKIQESIATSNRENSTFQVRQLIPFWCTKLLTYIPILNSLISYHELIERHEEARHILDIHVNKALDDISIEESIVKNLHADPRANLSRDELRRLMYEVMAAGTDTTSLTLMWACDYMARFHENGFSDFGPEQLNTIHRWASVVPLSLPHIARQDVMVGPYAIPKDSIVIYNLYGVHNKQLKQMCSKSDKSTAPQKVLPFSLGLRSCPGNRIAEEVLQHLLSAIHSEFIIKSAQLGPTEETNSTNYMSLSPIGLTRVPSRCTFIFNSRRAIERQPVVG